MGEMSVAFPRKFFDVFGFLRLTVYNHITYLSFVENHDGRWVCWCR